MGKKRDEKGNIKKFMLSTTASAVLLALILPFSVITMAFAWFSLTKESSLADTGAHIKGFNFDIAVKQDQNPEWLTVTNNDIELNFSDLYCGFVHRRTLSIEITNNNDGILYASWLLALNIDTDEIPYFDPVSNLYHYLGSQIKIADIKINGSANYQGIVGINQYLVTTSSDGLSDGQVTGITDPLADIPRVLLIEDLLIYPKQVVTIDITFVFADNGTDQTIYSGWLDNETFIYYPGICKRQLSFIIREEN